jgi:hypothetical protein
MRIRQDVAGLTVGDTGDAQTQGWHPVLDTYARGVAMMRALDDESPPVPESWLWAANTHGIDQFTTPRPAWAQCAHQSLFFLPWHRAYLAWFEGTIRSMTGEDDWALPYWNYSDPASDRALPAEFVVETRVVDGEQVPNPLFSPDRSPDPIPLDDTDVSYALGQPFYVLEMERGFGGVLPDQYDGVVELLPHNFIHGDIGGLSGFMRSPATAGRDPIFWLHHANIDRLWEVWLALDGSVRLTDPGAVPASVATAWNSAVFWFGDEQTPTTYAMEDVEDLTSAPMDYEYESLALPAELADAVAQAREAALQAAGGGIALDETGSAWQPVGATFGLRSGEERNVEFDSGPLGLDEAPPTKLMLDLSGTTATDPHAAYVVEVRSAPDAPPHVVGGFSTFGLAGTPDNEVRNYLVDATDALPALLEEGWSGGQLTVRLVPEAGRPDSDDESRSITVGQVTVYVQSP